MAKPIDRADVLRIIQQWFEGKEEPLVSFPDKQGFQNVVYLYTQDAQSKYDDVAQLTARASVLLETPVMVFVDPLYKAPKNALTCKEWLNL